MADNKEESLSSLTEFLNIDRELARYYLQKMRWNVEVNVEQIKLGLEIEEGMENNVDSSCSS